ncbi:transcriptional regulator, TetR family [Franzmannia pantelleriensis]|uniref:Transcriptional regulator, TetR family n=1 Tax=Franzmannia pantelleriensis TaxID=48727 RepID=A0A1G9LBZ0_9GAMM|nr:TetR/AcrR family transcriptional regulator [Halomonas pantelleriensis]SDL59404.1 transcriptional regulator, TetR family [Halomonas pantelleriensis]
MTGLRTRQKADRKRRILAASTQLFRSSGYRHVRIEDIAEIAEVSVGTVYNYYTTKGDILIAIVAMEVEEVLAAGETLLATPPAGMREALQALISHYYNHSLNYLSKEMWRAAMALSIEAPLTPNGVLYHQLDERLRAQVQALLASGQAQGEIDAQMDTDALGDLLFNSLNMMFVEFVSDDAMTLKALNARLSRQLDAMTQVWTSAAQVPA